MVPADGMARVVRVVSVVLGTATPGRSCAKTRHARALEIHREGVPAQIVPPVPRLARAAPIRFARPAHAHGLATVGLGIAMASRRLAATSTTTTTPTTAVVATTSAPAGSAVGLASADATTMQPARTTHYRAHAISTRTSVRAQVPWGLEKAAPLGRHAGRLRRCTSHVPATGAVAAVVEKRAAKPQMVAGT